MNRGAIRAQRELATAWQTVQSSMRRIYHASNVRPSHPSEIFRFDSQTSESEVKFNIKPIALLIPEHAGTPNPNLYIGIKGWLSFSRPIDNAQKLKARSFSTSIGYFRKKGNKFSHIYGVHYDCDESQFGHPVFHAQVGSQMILWNAINQHFRENKPCCDAITRISEKIRIPSAEMDIFSVFIQIIGDHLLHQDSSYNEREAFLQLCDHCDFFTGVANIVSRLQKGPPPYCYRGLHWYNENVV